MTAGLLTDVAERVVLGARNGVVPPTTEPVSDTATTPFGLTFRTVCAPGDAVLVRSADGLITMGSDRVTLCESDGQSEGSDTQVDYNVD